ncbi:Disease resistance protein RPM1 [Dichanthelium oligosanthes]|uniref:Disease resistance protein RPM1 n=1 Tax=Dichanthelium oligosanthes TaxID=888268 RepID=A0A1E5WDI1_9POAL|nr:Disease resistance protein RPM1 [Dichanthelium oligosanthes]
MEHAVVSAAEGAIHTLLGKLGAVLVQEAQLLGGVQVELQYLKDELESMTAFLQDLAERNEHRKQVKIWMKQVSWQSFHLGASGNSMAYDTPANHLNLDARITALFPERTQLVGVESRQQSLLRWLMDGHLQKLWVMSIFGFGGLGKTTLAMTTYQSLSATSGSFQCQAFVTVSQRFDVKVLIRDILLQIIQPVHRQGHRVSTEVGEASQEGMLKGMETWDVGQLASMLRQQLENKRYLIVLDDIWSVAAWEGFRFSLPYSNNGSRILVTTRIRAVAHSCCFHVYDRAYEIEPLTNYESRELFFKRIFGSTVNCPDNLREISEKILGKCGGTPLAIVSIAGLLASKPVHSKDQCQKIYGSLGAELETSPLLERLKKILELSYNDPPYHLKTCFLYLSIYPEDHKIRRKSVLRRWVAESFVTEKRGLSVFEVAESYFDEFINRSIIQPVEMSFSGKVKTFRVHDVMLEIIVTKSIEENFITLVEFTESTSQFISELGKLPQLRKLEVMMFVDDDNSWASLIENLSGTLCSLLLWRPDGAMNFDSLDVLSRPPMFMKSINFRGQLRKLPKWIPLLSNLTELTLRATELSAKEDLKVLARLPSLLYLRLHHSSYVEKEFVVVASEFPCLKLLVIHLAMSGAWKARFHEGALPRLEKLELSLFEETSIQEISGIEFLRNLKEVLICAHPSNTTKRIVQSLNVYASNNSDKPAVVFKEKQWEPMESKSTFRCCLVPKL